MSNEPNQDGLIVARRFARYHGLGSSWADAIIAAYLDPDRYRRELEREMSESE